MFHALRNLFALGLVRRSRRRGPIGRLFNVGLARRVSRRGGWTGGLARGGVAMERFRIGAGVVVALSAVAAAIYGARQTMRGQTPLGQIGQRSQVPSPTSTQRGVTNREEAPLR